MGVARICSQCPYRCRVQTIEAQDEDLGKEITLRRQLIGRFNPSMKNATDDVSKNESTNVKPPLTKHDLRSSFVLRNAIR